VRADGVPLSVVLVFDIYAGADVLLARPGIESLAGLKDRCIGFEQGAVGTLMLDHALREAGLAAGEVVQVPLPFDRHEAAWREGALDALITFEPVAGRLVGAGARADPELAAVFLRSLLHNAWKFTGRTPGARIEFGATGMDGERAFFVADNGAGFDPAHAKRLFKPFSSCMRRASSPAPASARRSSGASCSATAGASGPRPRRGRGQRSFSRFQPRLPDSRSANDRRRRDGKITEIPRMKTIRLSRATPASRAWPRCGGSPWNSHCLRHRALPCARKTPFAPAR